MTMIAFQLVVDDASPPVAAVQLLVAQLWMCPLDCDLLLSIKFWNRSTLKRLRSHCLPAFAPILVLAACAAPPVIEKPSTFHARPVAPEAVSEGDLSDFLAKDWSKFDDYAKHAYDVFAGKKIPLHWYSRLTPPLPTHWPPTPVRSVTYYAYAEYQESRMHGPALGRAAPWAKVVLVEGLLPQKMILATAPGPAVHYEVGEFISQEQGARESRIETAGSAALPRFIGWQAIPHDAAEIKIIKDYYCQWAGRNGTAKLITEHHRSFFEWLACPPAE